MSGLSSVEAARMHSRRAQAREALRLALSAVWSGADFDDTDAVIDHLEDAGYQVEAK